MRNRIFVVVYGFIKNTFADNIVGIAAQTAFFLLLSLFPLVMTVVSVLSRLDITMDSEFLRGIFPASVAEVIVGVIESGRVSTTFTVITLALSLWSASAGIWALMKGICLSHIGRNPKYLRGRATAMFVTVAFLVTLVLSLIVWVFGQNILKWAQKYVELGDEVFSIARYVFTFLLLVFFLLGIYCSSPGFSLRLRQLWPGAVFAAVGWVLISRLYELYISFFTDYSVLYGGVGAFIGLAVWLLLISFVILLGAEINSAIADTRNGSK